MNLHPPFPPWPLRRTPVRFSLQGQVWRSVWPQRAATGLSVDARLRQILCMGPSDHTQVSTPGAYACRLPGNHARARPYGARAVTPCSWDLVAYWAARQQSPHHLHRGFHRKEQLGPEPTAKSSWRASASENTPQRARCSFQSKELRKGVPAGPLGFYPLVPGPLAGEGPGTTRHAVRFSSLHAQS